MNIAYVHLNLNDCRSHMRSILIPMSCWNAPHASTLRVAGAVSVFLMWSTLHSSLTSVISYWRPWSVYCKWYGVSYTSSTIYLATHLTPGHRETFGLLCKVVWDNQNMFVSLISCRIFIQYIKNNPGHRYSAFDYFYGCFLFI